MPTLRLFGATLMPRSLSKTTVSPMTIRPPVGVSRPATQRMVEVLPQPDLPSRTSDSPFSMSMLRLSTAVASP